MQRVSSQLTIVLRIVLPTVWFTAVLSLVVLLWWAVAGRAGLFGNPFVWVTLSAVLASGLLFVKFILWRLYRVDMDDHFLYVSNYFKTYKYPHADIEAINASDIMPSRLFRITLKAKGSFGKNVLFLASPVLWKDYLSTHPGIQNLVK